MPKKKTTITDIARSCGVGVGTVSRAINGKPGVRDEIRRKILQYIEDIGWRSTSLQNRLKLPEPGPTVVFIAPISSLERKYHSELPQMLLERVTVEGFSPVVLYGRCRENLERCLSLKPHAVVVMAAEPFQNEAIRQLLGNGIRVVALGECEDAACPVVCPSHGQAARRAVELLLAAGHRRIGFLGGMGMLKRLENLDQVHVPRIRQMLAAICDEYPAFDLAADTVSDCFSDLHSLRRRLDAGGHTAWIASDEKMCRQFLHCATQLGIRIREDVSLVGFTPDLPFYAFTRDVTRLYPNSTVHVEQIMSLLQAEPQAANETYRADYLYHPGDTVREFTREEMGTVATNKTNHSKGKEG
jgi:LacI family transcriptional regulator